MAARDTTGGPCRRVGDLPGVIHLVESQDDLVIANGVLDVVPLQHALVGSDRREVLALVEQFRLADARHRTHHTNEVLTQVRDRRFDGLRITVDLGRSCTPGHAATLARQAASLLGSAQIDPELAVEGTHIVHAARTGDPSGYGTGVLDGAPSCALDSDDGE